MWNFLNVIAVGFYFLPLPITKVLWRLSDVLEGRLGAVLRYVILSRKFKLCGNGVYIGPYVSIDDPGCVSLGSNVSIHNGCTFLAKGGIEIGDNVAIAHGVSIVTGNHSWDDEAVPIKYNPVVLGRVTIANDCWLGCGVRVLAGVSLGERTIAAANSVLTKGQDGKCVVAGVPAKIIRVLD
jgi:acetyltransferase-like isoleucine patch superfamily enzyme